MTDTVPGLTDGRAAEPDPVSTWRRLREGVLAFDRGGVRLRHGFRMAVGTVLALAVGYAAGSWSAGAAAAGGALVVGVASVIPAPRPRVAVVTSSAGLMALGTFAGSATSGHAVLHVLVVTTFTFACGLLVAVEPAAAVVGINAVVGLLVFGRAPASPQTALQTAGLVAAGGVVQVLLLLLVHGRAEVGRALSGLSDAFGALARYAAELDAAMSSLPVAAAIDAAATDLEFSFATGLSGEACRSLTGEARRIRLELLSLASARSTAQEADHPDAELPASLCRLARCVAEYLTVVADGLGRATVPDRLDQNLRAVEDAIESLRHASTARAARTNDPPIDATDSTRLTAVRADAAAAALGGQLRAVAAMLPDAVDVKRPATSAAVRSAGRVSLRGARGAEAILERMRANLTWESDAFQHALRLAAVVSVSSVVAHVVGIRHGYWLALTAVVVLRPEFSVTFIRGLGRALGTFVGVAIASAIAVTVHPHGWLLVALVGVFVWMSGALFNASYALFSMAVTGAVVFLLSGIEPDPVSTAKSRLVATVLGAGLALGAYAVWPAWGRRRVADAVADLADATRRYVDLVLHALVDPMVDVAGTPAAGRAVRLARTNAESAIERSLGDPASRRIDQHATRELLAAFRRLAIASHTLRFLRDGTAGPDRRQAGMQAPLAELAAALDQELAAIAARLRFGRVTVLRQPLRNRHTALVGSLVEHTDFAAVDAAAGLLIAETDEMVDATNSLVDVLERTATVG